mmetsp:Transcript_36826/g.103898  ORF Transcript_36826/g.103898 Transcript_36826/m.103898 type:complete len:444 (+) Transcript_36826:316-1647(+)
MRAGLRQHSSEAEGCECCDPSYLDLEPLTPTQQKGFDRDMCSPTGSTSSSDCSSSSVTDISVLYGGGGRDSITTSPDTRAHLAGGASSFFPGGFWQGSFLAGCFARFHSAECIVSSSRWCSEEPPDGALPPCPREPSAAERLVDGVDIRGKVALVCDGKDPINLDIIRAMCKAGSHVVLACRCVHEGNRVATEVLRSSPAGSVSVMQCDLSDLESVREFCSVYRRLGLPLHFLINTFSKQRRNRIPFFLSGSSSAMSYLDLDIAKEPEEENRKKLDSADPSDCLGNFLLTELLLPLLQQTAFEESDQTRIINVSPFPLSNWENYAPTTQISLEDRNAGLSLALHAVELARRLAAQDPGRRFCPLVTINACSPDTSPSNADSRCAGSQAVACVHAAVSKRLRDVSGQCFEGTKPVRHLWSGFHMVETAAHLYDSSMKRVGLAQY